jgi:CRISPR-associated protein Cst1
VRAHAGGGAKVAWGAENRDDNETVGAEAMTKRVEKVAPSQPPAQQDMPLGYTGHPLVDVGVATVTAFSGKKDPSTLTEEDLTNAAEFLEREYFSGKLLSYLSCVFPNSAYVQPGAQPGAKVRMRTEKVEEFKREILYSFRESPGPTTGQRCVFCGRPSSRLVYRQHVPMITGEDVLNFFPAGLGGLAICGRCLLAIQAFPLGARRCHGRALAVHSVDDHDLTFAFASRFLNDNRRLLLLAEQSGEKYLDAKAPRTLAIHALTEIERDRRDRAAGDVASSVTVYHLTNSGQGPDLDIYHLPAQVVRFLVLADRAGTARGVWQRVQAGAWEWKRSPAGDGSSREPRKSSRRRAQKTAAPPAPEVSGPEVSRNFLYEDLFGLPGNSGQFVRTYLLRRSYRYAGEGDPRREYSLARDRDLVSWELAALFMREVMGMERTREEAIRTLGDRIATHIAEENDRRFFQGLYRANQYRVLRNLLIKASNTRLRRAQPPLIGFDEFLTVFEEGEEAARVDWALARDLVLIRVIEDLHRQEWFGRQPDVLDTLAAEDEEGQQVAG